MPKTRRTRFMRVPFQAVRLPDGKELCIKTVMYAKGAYVVSCHDAAAEWYFEQLLPRFVLKKKLLNPREGQHLALRRKINWNGVKTNPFGLGMAVIQVVDDLPVHMQEHVSSQQLEWLVDEDFLGNVIALAYDRVLRKNVYAWFNKASEEDIDFNLFRPKG
jgi:hypothetical protein